MPAPLANTPTLEPPARPSIVTPEGGPPPSPFRGDVPLAPDTLARETVGYTLSAVMKQADLSGPPRAPEVNAAGLDAARKKTELRLAIELAPSRMRVALLGAGWMLPAETELRARSDRYGHVVVWPGGGAYRPLAPGTLRALIGERRFDVAPAHACRGRPRRTTWASASASARARWRSRRAPRRPRSRSDKPPTSVTAASCSAACSST